MSPQAHGTGQNPRKPDAADIKRWRQYLADEKAEAAVYRDLAERRSGEEKEILLALADAEGRHEAHWRALLGDAAGKPRRPAMSTRVLGFLARRFGSVFVLALAQRAESKSPYQDDPHATQAMVADETIHEEVVRALAMRGRSRLAGTFRAAVFGANDGLVSNLALVLGISASGVDNHIVLIAGLSGLLAGALSMAAGEYVSVRSQLELLDASTPSPATDSALPHLDFDSNELALVYRARGESATDAEKHARRTLSNLHKRKKPRRKRAMNRQNEAIGTGMSAALSSFFFFASGAVIPVLPYIFGLAGLDAVIIAAVLVGLALISTGATVGLLSGASPLGRAIRQLLIGYGAAAATYLLGLVFGAGIGT